MDTWIILKDIQAEGERNHGLTIVKSRGMAHSNQLREYRLTANGFHLEDVYLGPQGVLTGAARAALEAEEAAASLARAQEIERQKRQIERKRSVVDARIAALRADCEAEEEELKKNITEMEARERAAALQRARISSLRKADKEGGYADKK
jgi:circadian clock protein KaiC